MFEHFIRRGLADEDEQRRLALIQIRTEFAHHVVVDRIIRQRARERAEPCAEHGGDEGRKARICPGSHSMSPSQCPLPRDPIPSSSTHVSIHKGCRLICRRTKSFFRLFLLSFFQFLHIPFYYIFAAQQCI